MAKRCEFTPVMIEPVLILSAGPSDSSQMPLTTVNSLPLKTSHSLIYYHLFYQKLMTEAAHILEQNYRYRLKKIFILKNNDIFIMY